MRVYVPSTLSVLPYLPEEGQVGPAPLAAFAATPALRREVGQDEEELEYAALYAAADASLKLIAADSAARRRRVVLAADVAEESIRARDGQDDPGTVAVIAPIPWTAVAAAHVDAPQAEADVEAALDGDPAACDGHELLWYATQEVAHLAG